MLKINGNMVVHNAPEAEPITENPSDHLIKYETIIESARGRAAEIIADAEATASRLIQEAEESRDQTRNNAYNEGYDDGYAIGETEASADYQSRLTEAQDLIRQAADERARIIRDSEHEIITLIMAVANKVIRQELEQTDAFLNLVRSAIEKLATVDTASLLTSSEDYERYFPNGSGEITISSGVVTLSVEKSQSLSPGDCILETSSGTVNSGVTLQLDRLEQSLSAECAVPSR